MTGAGTPTAIPGALIVGGAHVSIGIARSLGRRGIPVWLLASHPLPRFSRYVQRSFPWPGTADADVVASLIDIAVRHGLKDWVLLATGDEDMRIIAQNHARLGRYFRLTTPDWNVSQWIYDKRLVYQHAASLGIDCAWNHRPRSLADVEQLDCRFPVVLKPACRDELNEFTRAKAWKAESRQALLALYRRAAPLAGNGGVIIQSWIPGHGEAQFSYAGLWNNGRAVASLVARRRRQYPIDFGRSSTFVETVEQTEVEALASRFLESLGYSGVAEIEFKYDRRDRRYKLLDVNGRFWTWNGLGDLAGVDFPYLAWRQALGFEVPPARAKAGAVWIHASRDFAAAIKEIGLGIMSVSDYMASLRKRLAVGHFAFDDPLPTVAELPILVWHRLMAGRVARRAPTFSRPAP